MLMIFSEYNNIVPRLCNWMALAGTAIPSIGRLPVDNGPTEPNGDIMDRFLFLHWSCSWQLCLRNYLQLYWPQEHNLSAGIS